nr:cryptochrome/photolyase family protein [Anaerolineae bacterium]
SVLSPYINLGLLTPLQMVDPAVAAYEAGLAPLNAVEGFVRQVIGWREYMFWQYQRQMPGLAEANGWNATRDVPDWRPVTPITSNG